MANSSIPFSLEMGKCYVGSSGSNLVSLFCFVFDNFDILAYIYIYIYHLKKKGNGNN